MSKLSDATKSLLEQRLEAINDEVKGASDAASDALKQAVRKRAGKRSNSPAVSISSRSR